MRMEAIATSYIGTEAAMHALTVYTNIHGGHLAYGMRTALGLDVAALAVNHHLTMRNEPLRKFISGFAKARALRRM